MSTCPNCGHAILVARDEATGDEVVLNPERHPDGRWHVELDPDGEESAAYVPQAPEGMRRHYCIRDEGVT